MINLAFAVVLFWILLPPAQEQLNTRVGKVLPNTPAAAAQMHAGDKITAIDGMPVSTWEKLNPCFADRAGETGSIAVVKRACG